MYSLEHRKYLKKEKREKTSILFAQISIFFLFIFIWEGLVRFELINGFLFSSPYNVIMTIKNLYEQNFLFNHIFITVYETLLSFILGTIIGILIATIMWWNKFIAKVIDPYLTILNSLPKVALGPILIIWTGANMKSIIFMALLISVIITVINVYNGFISTDENKIKLMKSFKATKIQLFSTLIFPSNINVIVNVLKINVSMSLIGVIMGEFLVSKQGIGYLIMYGSQVFNLNLVITGVIILCFVSFVMYSLVSYIEKQITINK